MIGVIAQGETPEDNELQDGLTVLNDLLSLWSLKRTMGYRRVLETITLVSGTNSYSTSGFTARPIKIEDAYVQDSDGYDYPVKIFYDKNRYNAIRDKDVAGRVKFLYYDPDYANGTIYVYYEPDSAETLYMDCWEPLTAFSSLDTTVSMPPGYELALKSNGAVLMAPEYGTVAPQAIKDIAKESKKAIGTVNAQHIVADLGLPILSRRDRYNIYTGGW